MLDNFPRPCCDRWKPRPPGAPPLELPRKAIVAAMAGAKAAIVHCGELHPAKGIVKLAIEVAGDGHVETATVAESPDPALGECAAQVIKRITFAKSENGGSFTYPFKF